MSKYQIAIIVIVVIAFALLDLVQRQILPGVIIVPLCLLLGLCRLLWNGNYWYNRWK